MKREGRWGVVCMASYSYLALSPILTPSLACAWITDIACASFSTGLHPFKPPKCWFTALPKVIVFNAFGLYLEKTQ